MAKFYVHPVSFLSKSFLLFIVLLLTMLVTFRCQAQTTASTFPTLTLNTAVGIGSNLPPSYASITVPPISASLDIKILPQITVGPYLFYESISYIEFGGAGLRGTYHFPIPSKVFDVYAGAILSYEYEENREAEEVYASETNAFNSNVGDIGKTSESKVAYDVFVGGKACLTNAISAFAELGYGITYVNLGLAFTLK